MSAYILTRIAIIFYWGKKLFFGEFCFSGPNSNFFWDCKGLIITVTISAIIVLIFIFYLTLDENKELLDENKKLSNENKELLEEKKKKDK